MSVSKLTGQQAVDDHVWIFGYASLMWNPGFAYSGCKVGFIRNYVRRFGKNNTTHRGTEAKPGLLACLVKKEGSQTWGVAFEVKGKKAIAEAQDYLEKREGTGGYEGEEMIFYPRESKDPPFTVRVYSAKADNPLYLGPDPLPSMAAQIVDAQGAAGPNIDYVTRLAEFVRREIQEDQDQHLFGLEKMVKKLAAARL